MLCDSHCHFFSERFFRALARQQPGLVPADVEPAEFLCRRLGWDPPGSAEALADRWVAELDRHGVARAALMASVPGDEGSVAIAVGRHPDRVTGFFMVDPTQPGPADRVREAVVAHGLQVPCLFPAMHHYALDSAAVQAIFREAADLRASHRTAVFVHCGVLSVGVRARLGLPSRFDLRRGYPLDLLPAAQDHPSLPLILPHFGAGYFREALMLADCCPNVYLDTSSSNAWVRYIPGLTFPAAFTQALGVLGPSRLLFGTDSSFFPRGWQRSTYEDQRRMLTEIGVSETDQARILGGNFAELFGATS